jgi:hypothetical protein
MRPLPTHYQSLKNGQPMEIAQMATPYIDNAIRKIQDDRHHIYTPSHAVVWALYQEVLKRARQEATQKSGCSLSRCAPRVRCRERLPCDGQATPARL